MAEPIILETIGRFVQGSLFEGSTKDHLGNERRDRQGNPKIQFYLGLAVPQGDAFNALWAAITAKAALDFPGGEYNQPGFAWKIENGDQEKFANREGLAGHWLIRMTSGYAIKCVDASNPPQPITDPNMAKRGCYLQVSIGVVGNGQPPVAQGGKPGMYLNPRIAMLAGFGTEIVTGPNAAEVFAPERRLALPAGASATPLARPMPAESGAQAPANGAQGAAADGPPALPGGAPPAAAGAAPGAAPQAAAGATIAGATPALPGGAPQAGQAAAAGTLAPARGFIDPTTGQFVPDNT